MRLVENMDEKTYRSDPAISQSTIRSFLEAPTPYHFFKRHLDPDRQTLEPTPAMEFGTLFHARVELGDRFSEKYYKLPDGLRRGTKAYNAIIEENPHKTPVKASDWNQLEAMYKSLIAHPIVKKILKGGIHEESFFYTYGETPVKGRFDFRNPKLKIIVDFKTAQSGNPNPNVRKSFSKQVKDYRLDFQAGFYVDAMKRKTGEEYMFIFVTVEKSFPHAVALHALSSKDLKNATKECLSTLDEIIKRQSSKHWPCYEEKIHLINMEI